MSANQPHVSNIAIHNLTHENVSVAALPEAGCYVLRIGPLSIFADNLEALDSIGWAIQIYANDLHTTNHAGK